LARIVFARRTRDQFLALDSRLADAVRSALTLLEADPEVGAELRGRLRGLRSLRVGTYRLIYEVRKRGETVRLLSIRHRAVVYKADPRS